MENIIEKLILNGNEYELPSGITSSNNTYDDIVHLSQAEYEALETKDPNTLYSTPDDESGAFEPENTGTTGQILTKTNTGYAYQDAPTELPSSGTEGQILKKTDSGVEFADNDYLISPFYKLLNGTGTKLSEDTATIPTTAGSGQIGSYRFFQNYRVYVVEIYYQSYIVGEYLLFAYPNMSQKSYKKCFVCNDAFDGSANPQLYISTEVSVSYSSNKPTISKQKSYYKLKSGTYGGGTLKEIIYGYN